MFNNFVNVHDVVHALKKGARFFSILAGKIASTSRKRVEDTWAVTECPASNWWDIPEVNSRWNTLITGSKDVEYYEYIADKYFRARKNLIGLSLGCGTGHRELKWVGLKNFKRIEAVDISKPRIEKAMLEARARGYGDIITYKVDDIYRMDLSESHYDAIFVESSLHHFSPLREILVKINSSLKPDGYFIMNEFVGPTRFQWTERQLEVINGLLSVLPTKYKMLWRINKSKSKVVRPSKLSMILGDPSEAIESSEIMSNVIDIFEVVEVKHYGGTILHMLLSGIGHNFLSADVETRRWLNVLFEAEDLLMLEKEITSDYVVAVCRKK